MASGVLLALSFPKFGHGLVAWVALVPLLVALAGARGASHGFRLGYLTGAVSSLGIVYWTSLVVVQYGGLSMPMGIAVMCLLCLALALFPCLFGWIVACWARTWDRRPCWRRLWPGWGWRSSAATRCSTSRGACSATASTRSSR